MRFKFTAFRSKPWVPGLRIWDARTLKEVSSEKEATDETFDGYFIDRIENGWQTRSVKWNQNQRKT